MSAIDLSATVAKLEKLFPKDLHDQILLSGGMVRDLLLGVTSQDFDLITFISKETLLKLGFRLVECKTTPNIYFNFSSELGKVEIIWLQSFNELLSDLRRRDFKVNAMAMKLDGTLIDPLDGQNALKNKILSSCSSSSFIDDPIRIFRALRFESDGWRLDKEAEADMKTVDWFKKCDKLPQERFSQELLKSLGKSHPDRFFSRMVELDIGRVFLPEIFQMTQVPAGPIKYHPEGDLFSHSLEVLQKTSLKTCDSTARFCAMFHDFGKLFTPVKLYPKHHGHDLAGATEAEAFCKRLRLPLTLQRALQGTSKLHDKANKWQELRDATKIRLAQDCLKFGIASFLPYIVAADSGEAMDGFNEVLRVASLSSTQLGIDSKFFDLNKISAQRCQEIIMAHRIKALQN